MREQQMKNLIVLELNELNFDFLKKYIELGYLPTFKNLMENHPLKETLSEKRYKELEPWIQWVTVHTGKTFEEHGIFRLGDAADQGTRQIWEELEENYNVSVGAISPMNAKDQTKSAKFFMPDPWSANSVTGSKDLKLIYKAAHQAVNDNSNDKITFKSILNLLYGAALNIRISSISTYLKHLVKYKQQKWRKALILDRLLSDVFITKWLKYKPQFTTLFMNAGAHIQHHYMYNSSVYSGKLTNPEWYSKKGIDPVLECYQAYDSILADFIKIKEKANFRLMILTGLSQKPNTKLVFYYRPKVHQELLEKMGISFQSVDPRMSRDFLVRFDTEVDAKIAEEKILDFEFDGQKIFSVDNRGNTLFCQLSYTNEIKTNFIITNSNGINFDLSKDVVHVSIENGIHRTIGYFLDTNDSNLKTGDIHIPLTDVYKLFLSNFEKNKQVAS
jgi:hypothetical protein